MNSSILSKNWTLIGTTNKGKSGPRSSGNIEVLNIPQSSKTGASSWDPLVSFRTLVG